VNLPLDVYLEEGSCSTQGQGADLACAPAAFSKTLSCCMASLEHRLAAASSAFVTTRCV